MITDPNSDEQRDEQSGHEDRVPGAGDDERENREHLAETGEPKRDEFGNADGAS